VLQQHQSQDGREEGREGGREGGREKGRAYLSLSAVAALSFGTSMCCSSTRAICESFVFQGACKGAEDGREDEVPGEEEEEEEVAAAAAALAALFSKRVMVTRAGSIAPSSPRQAQTA